MIEDDKFRGIRILRLKRSERRMKRTSLSMLQSWRANCDVSVLIYDHDPASISCSDIANVSGYVVAYCTKGNMSFKTETEALKTLILATENDFIEGAKISTVTLARRILNTFHAKRVITKAEASCELLKLNLYECTENIVKVPLSSHTKIRKGKFKGIQSSALYKYINSWNSESQTNRKMEFNKPSGKQELLYDKSKTMQEIFGGRYVKVE